MNPRSLLALALCLATAANMATAADAGAQGNVYTAGPTVEITQPVAGDLLAAAGRIRIEQPVQQDAALAAGDVSVQAGIGQDLRAAAGQLVVAGRVGGDAHLAGGTVRLERTGEIAGRGWIAGGDVQVLGRLGERTKIYAGKLAIGGEVAGDLQVSAETIELLPGAQLKGSLRYASPNPVRIAEGASVAGSVERQPLPQLERSTRKDSRFGAALWLVSLFAAGVVWLLLFPAFAQSAQAQLQKAPWASLGIGFGVLVAMPVAVALLAITIVGAPLALALLAAYGLVLLAGYLVVAGTLAERMLLAIGKVPTTAWRLGTLALALLLLVLAGAIPLLGWLIAFVALMAGTGALIRQRMVPRA